MMNDQIELATLLRRTSNSSRHRASFLLYALRARSTHTGDKNYCTNDDECTSKNTHGDILSFVSLQSIYKIISFALPLPRPRFLFALSDTNVLLRSGDMGKTWAKIYSLCDTAATPKPKKDDPDVLSLHVDSSDDCKTGTSDCKTDTNEPILVVCDSDESEDALRTIHSTNDASSSRVLTCVACNDDYIALGGVHSFLAISANKGLTFSRATFNTEAVFSKNSNVKHLCFAGHVLVVGDEKTVCSFSFAYNEHGCILEPIANSLVCSNRICFVRSFSLGQDDYEIVVSDTRQLHFSWNGGRDYFLFSHTLGSIRDMTPFDVIDNYRLPPFPEGCTVVKEVLKKNTLNAQNKTVMDRPERCYEYAQSGTFPHSERVQRSLDRLKGMYCTTHVNGISVLYRYYLIAGTGTEVLENDYSCLLCVGIAHTGSDICVVCVGKNVEYSPYTRSNMTEPVLCALTTVLPSASANGGFLAARSNIDGVSFSRDLKMWTPPTRSLAVLLTASGSGEFVLCERGNMVSVMKESESTCTNIIPCELHIRSILCAVSL